MGWFTLALAEPALSNYEPACQHYSLFSHLVVRPLCGLIHVGRGGSSVVDGLALVLLGRVLGSSRAHLWQNSMRTQQHIEHFEQHSGMIDGPALVLLGCVLGSSRAQLWVVG